MSKSPTLDELITTSIDYALRGVRVSVPAKVVAVRGKTVDVQPLVDMVLPGDGVSETVTLPVIPDVPVGALRFGSWFIRAPLAVADVVLLVFADGALERYRGSAGDASVDPLDDRIHHLADAVALPVDVYPDAAALDAVDHLVIGKVGGSASIHLHNNEVRLGSDAGTGLDFVALASKVNQQINNLRDAVATWTPVPNDGGAALKLALASWLLDTANVGATKVKAE